MKKCTQIGKVSYATNKNFSQIDKVRSTTKNISQIDRVRTINRNIQKTNKPLVSILLAVYKPNEKWLIEQLISLNKQSYQNLNLFVYDDCPEFPVDESIVAKYITNFTYKIIRGKKNRGSNKVFEELTKLGDGEYFAYCDQDDIWEENKIFLLMEKFKNKDVTLVCSDLSIIDENSTKIADSITKIRKKNSL